jgi:hypothetical protein
MLAVELPNLLVEVFDSNLFSKGDVGGLDCSIAFMFIREERTGFLGENNDNYSFILTVGLRTD